MNAAKKDIIEGLKKELLCLQGLADEQPNTAVDATLGKMKWAFPNHSFPVSAVHEFITDGSNAAATNGFVSILLSALMQNKGTVLWISCGRSVFPPALQGMGITPGKIIFIILKTEKQVSWAMEEALKCTGLSAVISELKELSFTTSRRLQLAVEKSHVTGFVLRSDPRQLQSNACVSRWLIKPVHSELSNRMPGVGFPRWEVALLKIRNGVPAKWLVEYRGGRMRYISPVITIALEKKKKAV